MADDWEKRFEADSHIQPDDAANITANSSAEPSSDVDYEHKIYSRILDGKTHLAPIESPKKILNLGCKTGTWVNAIAAQYPNAEAVGIGPKELPAGSQTNSRFEVRDIEAKDSALQNTFDFVYSRDASPQVKNWNAYLPNLLNYLTPGGWVELIEWDIHVGCDDETFSEASASRQFHSTLVKNFRAAGRDLEVAQNLKRNLESVGFTNVQERVTKVPMSQWPKNPQYKELGSYALASTTILQQYAEHVMGLPQAEARELVGRVIVELKSNKVHVYSRIRLLIGQKPKA